MVRIYEKIPYFNSDLDDTIPNLEPFLIQDDNEHPAFIVVPGGSYEFLADHEGAPIAAWLNTLGINAFVLTYRTAPYKHPCPLLDLQRAIRFLRYNSKKFKIHKNKIGVLGFSAGGHLTASSAVFFDNGMKDPFDEIDKESCRPDLTVLCYPVINLQEYTHQGSRDALIGKDAPETLAAELSVEKQVKADTPPAFIWTTAEDSTVPMENSMLYAKALNDKNIPFEMHIFPKGHHGLGLTDEIPYVKRWGEMCEMWLKEMLF